MLSQAIAIRLNIILIMAQLIKRGLGQQRIIKLNSVQPVMALLFSVLIITPVSAFQTSAEVIRTQLMNANSPQVLVVAHRAAWKQAPENSLLSIEHAIDIGVDIIEVDIRRTKDGEFVLMHDRSLNRTTNGKGKVADKTWAELQSLRLKNTDGSLSNEVIPHLRDALAQIKDKVLIDLDKAEPYFAEVLAVVRETGTERQVILKGKKGYSKAMVTLNKLGDFQGIYMPKFNFSDKTKKRKKAKKKAQYAEQDTMAPTMPPTMTALPKQPLISDIKRHNSDDWYAGIEGSVMAEIKFSTITQPQIQPEVFKAITSKYRLWVNTLKVSHSANFTDKRALKKPDAVWGELIKMGNSVIQTDEPRALLTYLRTMKYHD